MSLFSLIGRLSLDSSQFDAGLKRAESTAQGAGKKIGSALSGYLSGAAIAGFAAATIKSVTAIADEINNLADAYGLTAEQIQKMQAAATMNGVSVDQLAAATSRLNQARQNAIEGDKLQLEAFQRLGFSQDDLSKKSKTTWELLIEIAKASAGSANNFERQSAMADLLGTRSVRLSQAIRDLAKESPITLLTSEQVNQIDKLGDEMTLVLENAKRIAGIQLSGPANLIGKLLELVNKGAGTGIGRAIAQGGIGNYMDVVKVAFKGAKTLLGFPGDDGGQLTKELEQKLTEARRRVADEAKKEPPKPEAGGTTERKQSPFIAGGANAAMGGLFFGGSFNQQILKELGRQKMELEKIAKATEESAKHLDPASQN